MSMIGNFRAADDQTIDRLLADPNLISDFLYSDAEPTADDGIDCDKSWAGIHYLLTGDAWGGKAPLNFILAGTPIGNVDVGYGPARAHRSSELSAISAALAPIDTAELSKRFDPAAMEAQDIYPGIWDEGDEALEYLTSYYEELKRYIANAVEKRRGLLVWIS